jgi:hypothetical protein
LILRNSVAGSSSRKRRQAVARLPVQQARLRVAQIEAVAGTRHGDVHQPSFLLQAVALLRRVLVREKTLFEAGDEDDIELESLGSMHGHQLDRFLALAGLMLAGLQRGVREKGSERTAIRRLRLARRIIGEPSLRAGKRSPR